jgi:hypothetical protein
MLRTKLSEQEWQTLLGLAARLGIPVPELLGRPVRFTEMESAGHRLGRAVAQLTTGRLAGERAEQSAEQADCPTCGEACRVEQQQRKLITVDGPVEFHEPVAHCSACRRDFFPSAGGVGARSAAE